MLLNSQPGYDWEDGRIQRYFAGAAERAHTYGYRLEKFLLNATASLHAHDLHSPRRNNTASCSAAAARRQGARLRLGSVFRRPRWQHAGAAVARDGRYGALPQHAHAVPSWRAAATGIGLVIDRTTDHRAAQMVLRLPGRTAHWTRLVRVPASSTTEPGPDRHPTTVAISRLSQEHRLDALDTSITASSRR